MAPTVPGTVVLVSKQFVLFTVALLLVSVTEVLIGYEKFATRDVTLIDVAPPLAPAFATNVCVCVP